MEPTILIMFNDDYVVLYCISNNNLYPFFVDKSVYNSIIDICKTTRDIFDIKDILVKYNANYYDFNYALMREIELIGYITGGNENEDTIGEA